MNTNTAKHTYSEAFSWRFTSHENLLPVVGSLVNEMPAKEIPSAGAVRIIIYCNQEVFARYFSGEKTFIIKPKNDWEVGDSIEFIEVFTTSGLDAGLVTGRKCKRVITCLETKTHLSREWSVWGLRDPEARTIRHYMDEKHMEAIRAITGDKTT